MGKGGHAGGFGVSLGGRKTAILAEARGFSGPGSRCVAESGRSSQDSRGSRNYPDPGMPDASPRRFAGAAVRHFDSVARHA
ncbi:hypothetical protein CBM2587_A230064 [Cupriavidus taiwanensis]|uniref:Uncharacterized protein n=1 Tax=Cupriavidus taiwanensis TaxID=164546 RepID=A0A976A1E4_9BURK|nr:hypothetical protein CBM2587_A230064 [Cupriavidus taiwanensis]